MKNRFCQWLVPVLIWEILCGQTTASAGFITNECIVSFLKAGLLSSQTRVDTYTPGLMTLLKLHRNPDIELSTIEKDAFELIYGQGSLERFKKFGHWSRSLQTLLPSQKFFNNSVQTLPKKMLSFFSPKIRASIRQRRKVLNRLLDDPDTILTEQDVEAFGWPLIEKDHNIELMRSMSREVGPRIKRLNELKRTSLRAFWVLVAAESGISLISEKVVHDPADQFGEKNPPGSDEVEVIYNSPAGHAAIRIGNTVYNFGVGRRSEREFTRYMKESAAEAEYNSSTRVRFKLNPKEVTDLKTYLEQGVGESYLMAPWPIPLPFNCVSAVNKTLREHTSIDTPPPGFDRSAKASQAWYKGQLILGTGKVSEVEFHPAHWYPVDKLKDEAGSLVDTLYFNYFLSESAIASVGERLVDNSKEK